MWKPAAVHQHIYLLIKTLLRTKLNETENEQARRTGKKKEKKTKISIEARKLYQSRKYHYAKKLSKAEDKCEDISTPNVHKWYMRKDIAMDNLKKNNEARTSMLEKNKKARKNRTTKDMQRAFDVERDAQSAEVAQSALEAWLGTDPLEPQEIRVVEDLWREFRPYLRSAISRRRFVFADYVPFIVLANNILFALDQGNSSRNLMPALSSGSMMALDVTATTTLHVQHYGICTLAVSVSLEKPAPYKTHKTTAMNIHVYSMANKHARLREQRKRLRADVAEQEALLSRASSSKSVSLTGVILAHEAWKKAAVYLRSFYESPRHLKESYTREIFLRRTYQKLAAKESRFARKSSNRKAIPIRCVGNKGTGVGSSLRGRLRYGGKQLRSYEAQNTVVAITDEHRTSKTCAECLGAAIRPTYRYGTTRKANLGAARCLNSQCPLVRAGMGTQGRDSMAARCIARAGKDWIMQGQAPLPFNKEANIKALLKHAANDP
ncbi:hypothetical protein BCR43DRAFT_512932 [Syncephalastrum racemosum]|uniref:Uncharacterized protein n=1 Tax=Syncephalastrum racemosum TaxID=13706 RepID=A0A1X2HI74_SYNRA|nr:hypothetical protein BCR43DRAFT_512932 [Syncephalastrum racemosum]